MKVQDIYFYPVKSLGGLRTAAGRVMERGFEYDRRWMLVDEKNVFISQRSDPQLSLLTTKVTQEGIVVSSKEDPERGVIIPFAIEEPIVTEVSIWDDRVKASGVGEKCDQWFSEYLGRSCRLVHLPETGQRGIDARYAVHEEQVSFADAFPYLLIGQASLDDLNRKLEVPVGMNRFRPNIVFCGAEPFEEDRWKEIQIGAVKFKVAKPCARCVITTVDQETGIKGKEPLLTLSNYRRIGNKVLFGQNLIALNEGIIRENDPLEVLSYRD